MADLDQKESSDTVKIAGTTPTGAETNFVKVTNAQEMGAVDILNGTGVGGNITVGTAPVELKVGASKLAGRKFAAFTNTTSTTIYWGWTNGVTITTGHPIYKKQTARWAVSDTATVFLIAGSAGNIGRASESA